MSSGDADPVISWCWSGDTGVDPPFWTDTANRLMRDPFRLLFQHTGADRGLFVDYTELPGAITTRMQPHSGLAATDPDRAVLAMNAKNPVLAFTPDGPEKQAAANPALRETTVRLVGEAYSAFEAARLRQLSRACRP